MGTRRELRAALDALAREVTGTGIGAMPLIVEGHRRGDGGETRPPGVYYRNPVTRGGSVIVYEGADPPEELLARFKPKSGPGPLVIVFGPEVVEPPASEPEPLPPE